MTGHLHRFVVLVPAAAVGAWNTWIAANLPGHAGFTVGLSASGAGPASHYWLSAALRDGQALLVLRRLATVAQVEDPPVDGTRAERRAWLAGLAGQLAARGVRVAHGDNERGWARQEAGGWPDPEALLAAAGLRRLGDV